MRRFFEFLLPERTHLKAVIAALVAIFVLSGVLAFQVRQSEIGRQRLEEAQIQAFQKVALRGLYDNLERKVFNHLRGAFFPAMNAVDVGLPSDEVGDSVNVDALAGDFSQTLERSAIHVLSLDELPHETWLSPEFKARLLSADTALTAPFKDGWWTSIVATRESGVPRILAYTKNDLLRRAFVIELPSSFLGLVANSIVRDQYMASEFTNDHPLDSIFRVEAESPAIGKVLQTSKTRYAARPASITLSQAFFPGLQWTVGVLPMGRELFVPSPSVWMSPTLLYTLMILIAAVIVMAIALVRREEELHRLRSDLISGVSHELRTPLAQIRMFAETLLLGRTRTDSEKRRSLEVIDQEAKRLSHFVENMLQFAKGEGGRTRLVPELTSFAVEVRRSVESFAPMCQARGVEVRTELEEGVTATVDRAALRRIMLNLMENALKYGPDDQRITVGIALFNDVVRLWVDDEGEGIPRLDRERVFDSFYRLNRDLDRRVTGSGIGLAVVRQLAELHGGRAWAEDAPGGGARIVVEFPDAYVRPSEDNTGWAVA